MPSWLSAAVVIGGVVSFLWFEIRRPLRRSKDSKLSRNVRNGLIGITAAAAMHLTEVPLARRMTQIVERRRWGLTKWLQVPVWLETLLALALLDYTLYLWHMLAHRVPLLWRFHLPHHVDVDLDVSTGLRFHFGEIALGAPYRAVQILLIGVSPFTLSIWQTLMLISIAFHHSNIRLAPGFERRLLWFIVTPRMHGIHHSMIPEETNSNFCSGLSIWDRLHGTMRLNIPQPEIAIGIPAYPNSIPISDALAMPFLPQQFEWTLPDDGIPSRVTNPRPTLLVP